MEHNMGQWRAGRVKGAAIKGMNAVSRRLLGAALAKVAPAGVRVRCAVVMCV